MFTAKNSQSFDYPEMIHKHNFRQTTTFSSFSHKKIEDVILGPPPPKKKNNNNIKMTLQRTKSTYEFSQTTAQFNQLEP